MKSVVKYLMWSFYVVCFLALGLTMGLQHTSLGKSGFVRSYRAHYPKKQSHPRSFDPFYVQLANAAEKRLDCKVTYDGSYQEIAYPMGDVAPDKGVCSDVVIRSYRAMGVDLQELIHNDMKDNFWKYPKLWRLFDPDANIDHRRVPNLMVFFKRMGAAYPISVDSIGYLSGDMVAWDLGEGLFHIGLVSTQHDPESGTPLIVHNIGRGPELGNILFKYKIIGHFRYGPR